MTNDRVTSDALPEQPQKEWSVQRLGRVRLEGDADLPLTPALAPERRGSDQSQLSGPSPPTIADVGVAQVDLDRRRRCGFSEVVFGQGKSPEAIEKIFAALLASGEDAFATRIDAAQAEHLRAKFPPGRYNQVARTFIVDHTAMRTLNVQRPTSNFERSEGCSTLDVGRSTFDVHSVRGRVAVVTAGTSDLPVAEEARETALWMGVDVTLVCDVGVAGPQRLTAHLPQIQLADAVVVVAGMEGALPSVVGGHVACPVIAVPTSVGYGANLGGIAALLAMLNSCAANVTVVNIDAGFKGGYLAGMIAHRLAEVRCNASARGTIIA